MAKSTRYFSEQPVDFAQGYINIDTLCDVLTKTQIAEGRKPTFQLREKYRNLNINNEEKETPKCPGTCPKKCHKIDITDTDFHHFKAPTLQFGVNNIEDEDDEDDLYICEYCDALGYGKKYKPDVCDSCNLCETCAEYLDEECSGCSYSVYRDGTYFRDKLDETDLINSDDLDKINKLGEESNTQRVTSKRFTILRR